MITLNTQTKRIAFDAILLAVLCALGCLSIPMGENVKVSLQLLVIFIIGLINPYLVDSLIIAGSYLLLGMFLPIYAGFNAGVTPTFGYVIGFLFSLMGMKLISYIKMNRIVNDVLQCLVATLIVYIIGTLFMYFYLNSKSTYTLSAILGFSIVPYLPFDAAKIVIAVLAAIPLRKVIKAK